MLAGLTGCTPPMPYRAADGIESHRNMVKNMLPGGQNWLAGLLLLSVACGSAVAESGATHSAAVAAQNPPIATDWRTGLAIYGVDPVAYFAEGRTVEGEHAWELAHGGAVWRFKNEANRAAFAADPDVYMPQFAGNDAVALTRGVVLKGNPHVWVLFERRLYLFHTPEARAAFLAAPQAVLAKAEDAAEAAH
jgi:hypothetical protein